MAAGTDPQPQRDALSAYVGADPDDVYVWPCGTIHAWLPALRHVRVRGREALALTYRWVKVDPDNLDELAG